MVKACIVSDVCISLAYKLIPLILAWFYTRRTRKSGKLILPTAGVWLFAAFITCCGLTHDMDYLVFVWPAYRLDILIRAITATISLCTVVWMIAWSRKSPYFMFAVEHEAEPPC